MEKQNKKSIRVGVVKMHPEIENLLQLAEAINWWDSLTRIEQDAIIVIAYRTSKNERRVKNKNGLDEKEKTTRTRRI